MKKIPGKWEWLIAIVIPALWMLFFRWEFPANVWDDAFISFKTAVSLGDGKGMTFNPGDKVYLVTTPLWVFLLAGVRSLTGDVILAAKVLGIIFELAFIATFSQLCRTLTGCYRTALLASILIVANPVFLFTSFSGMEQPMYLFLLSLSFLLLGREKYMWSLIVAAISIWARFDGIIIYGVVFIWVVYKNLPLLKENPHKVLVVLLPSILIIAGYIFFGWFYFGDIVPTSIQWKVKYGPDLLSIEWRIGVFRLLKNFIYIFIGRSSYWFTRWTPLIILLVPFLIGIYKIKLQEQPKIIPLFVYTVLYILSFIISGNSYATNFPWYFVIALPVMYIATSRIIARWMSKISLSFNPVIIFAILWPVIMAFSISGAGRDLHRAWEEREKTYAATTIWLCENLGPETSITSNEIGAIGFFCNNETTVLDMFGILRVEEDRNLTSMEIVRKYEPDAVLSRDYFPCKDWVIEEMGDEYYTWIHFRSLDIGIRSENSDHLVNSMSELENIFNEIDMNHEYDWGESSVID